MKIVCSKIVSGECSVSLSVYEVLEAFTLRRHSSQPLGKVAYMGIGRGDDHLSRFIYIAVRLFLFHADASQSHVEVVGLRKFWSDQELAVVIDIPPACIRRNTRDPFANYGMAASNRGSITKEAVRSMYPHFPFSFAGAIPSEKPRTSSKNRGMTVSPR